MTKLNITNKRIYKLKKHKNQSKKNVPKKRKKKKRGRLGRSFRKRRRKYNIKNNSIKNYKKQKGGVKTDTEIISNEGKVTKNVFKSKQLQALEKKLGNVQRKIQKLNEEKKGIETRRGEKRQRNTISNQMVEELTGLYQNMEGEGEKMKTIKQIQELHKGIDDDVKKLADFQIRALKINADIEHTQTEINIIGSDLNLARTADKAFQKASNKKKRDVKNQQRAVIKEENLNKMKKNTEDMLKALESLQKESDEHQKEITDTNQSADFMEEEEKKKLLKELTGKRDASQKKYVRAKKKYDNALENFNSKKTNSAKAIETIDRLNDEFNTNYETKKTTDDNRKKATFIESHGNKFPFLHSKAGEKLKYLETLKYAFNEYKKELQIYKKKRNNENLNTQTIKLYKHSAIDSINKTNTKKKDQEIATETATEEKLIKEIEALTKKEDEKLSAETDKIAEGLKKTGEFPTLKKNIEEQEDVVKTSHEETDKAKKLEEEAKKAVEKAEQGRFFTQARKDKKIEKVKGELGAAEADRLAKETQEKKADESLRAKKHWEKGIKGVGSVLRTKIKCSLIVPYVDDNDIQTRWRMMYNDTEEGTVKKQEAGEKRKPEFQKFLKDSIESFRVLTDQPYIYNPEGPYARTMDYKQLNKMGEKPIKFYNYYLKKVINSADGKELSLVEMISQRMARYLNYVMKYEGTEDTKKLHKETIALLNKKINDLFKPTHLEIPIGEKSESNFRNYLNEKIHALTFLEILLKQTVKSFPEEDSQRYIDLMETKIGDQPLFNIFCTYLDKCYDTVPGQKIIALETEYGKLGGDGNEIMKKGLDGVTVVNEPCVPPDDDNDDLYMRVSRGIDLYSRETLDAEEKEKQDFLQALKKYEEHAKETEEMKKEIQDLLPKLQDKIGKIKKDKYFVDSIIEELKKVEQETHGINVVTERVKIKNNTEQAAKIEAVKDKLKEEMAKAEKDKAKLESEKNKAEKAKAKLLEEKIQLEGKVANLTTARDSCDADKPEMLAKRQQLLDEMQQRLDEKDAAIETAKQQADTLTASLDEEDQKTANLQAKSESIAQQEELLKKERAELAQKKETKDEEDDMGAEDEEDDIDLGGIIDEMTPETNVELEFPEDQKELVIYAAYDPETKQVKIDHRFLGSQGRIEDVISNYGIGTEAAN